MVRTPVVIEDLLVDETEADGMDAAIVDLSFHVVVNKDTMLLYVIFGMISRLKIMVCTHTRPFFQQGDGTVQPFI